MCREGTGNASKLWEGLCPTASGRRPSVQVTDPPYKLVERKKGSGLSPFCSLERLPDLPKVTRWHPGLQPGLCDCVQGQSSLDIILQLGQDL